jgi:hypothetical protein
VASRKIYVPSAILPANPQLRIAVVPVLVAHNSHVDKMPRQLRKKLMIGDKPNRCLTIVFERGVKVSRNIVAGVWRPLHTNARDVAVEMRLIADNRKLTSGCHTPNEIKISDGYRERAPIDVEVF